MQQHAVRQLERETELEQRPGAGGYAVGRREVDGQVYLEGG